MRLKIFVSIFALLMVGCSSERVVEDNETNEMVIEEEIRSFEVDSMKMSFELSEDFSDYEVFISDEFPAVVISDELSEDEVWEEYDDEMLKKVVMIDLLMIEGEGKVWEIAEEKEKTDGFVKERIDLDGMNAAQLRLTNKAVEILIEEEDRLYSFFAPVEKEDLLNEIVYSMEFDWEIEEGEELVMDTEYTYEDLGLSFVIPGKYSGYSAFKNSDDESSILIDDFDGEVYPWDNLFGDAWSLGVWILVEEESSLDSEVEMFMEFEGGYDLEEINIGNTQFTKLKWKGLGGSVSIEYFTEVNDKLYRFHTPEAQEDLLLAIIESADFFEEKGMFIMDYYEAIPDEYFGGVALDERLPDQAGGLDIIDADNWYVEMNPGTLDGSLRMTVFLHDGEKLFAAEWRGCGPLCEQKVSFLRYKNGDFVDVTDEVLPEYDLGEIEKEYLEKNGDFAALMELPRYGTTIEIIEQYSGDILMKLQWENGVFEKT